jgi:large subunit ribosomal protein L10
VFKAEKQEVVTRLKEQFGQSTSVICVDFRGVNVDKITRFRRELRDLSANYVVVKNTLARRAIAETAFQNLDQFLAGPTGIIFCPEDVAASAKVVTKFANEDGGALEVKGGMVEGAVFDAAGIKKVATLPSRQELLAQLVASLQAPISGLVGVLQGVISEFVYTLQAIADKKNEQ